MQLSDDARMLRDLVDDFGKKELMDAYRDLEPTEEFPTELVKKISDMGLMGISFPEEYGGMGMGTIATSVVGERLAFYWPSLQLIWSANVSLAGFPIATFGSERQKKTFLPRLATGDILGCYALTEPGAGSDAASIATTAIRDERDESKRNKFHIKGTKVFITNANNASVCVLFATPRVIHSNGVQTLYNKNINRHAGITAFILDGLPGLQVPRGTGTLEVNTISKWGLKASHFCELVFDCYINEDNVLGEIGKGFDVAMQTLNNGRINIAAQAVGIARRALHEAKEFAKTRRAFGKILIEMDTRTFPLASLEAQVEAAWQMTLAASASKDRGEDYRFLAAQAKLVASEVAVQCAMENYRMQGGIGYTRESISMSILHDALATITYEGTSDIQKLTIAKSFS
jgi:alkylation response protein AidB-like acyl-CoA dehydrogenase